MGRACRIEYEETLYHTLSRGNEQGDIFYDTATVMAKEDKFKDYIENLNSQFKV